MEIDQAQMHNHNYTIFYVVHPLCTRSTEAIEFIKKSKGNTDSLSLSLKGKNPLENKNISLK